MPSVTISDGTLAMATSTPLTMPQAMPLRIAATSPAAATPIPLPPIASISLAATTDANTRTEPTERSMPEVMITNVMPRATGKDTVVLSHVPAWATRSATACWP